MTKKKKNIFKLLYSEYKNKNYSGLFHYGMKVFDLLFSAFLVFIVSSLNTGSTISIVAIIVTSMAFLLNLFLFSKQRKIITRVTTEEIKDYLMTLQDSTERENKVKMIACCMLKNKDVTLFLEDFLQIQAMDIKIEVPDNELDYEKIIKSLSSVDVKQEIKEKELYTV